MGQDELDQVYHLAGRSCVFHLGFRQSQFKHSTTLVIVAWNEKRRTLLPFFFHSILSTLQFHLLDLFTKADFIQNDHPLVDLIKDKPDF